MKHLLPLGGLLALTIGAALPSSAQTILSDSPILNDVQTKKFWQQLDTNNADFKKDLISKLATQAYRKVGAVPSVRAFVLWDSNLFPPPIAGATPELDSDDDGMPDAWEKANKLDSKNPADGTQDTDKDGYTNLEEFLNRTNPRKFVDYTNPKNNVHTLH